jgi:hypothetical protein
VNVEDGHNPHWRTRDPTKFVIELINTNGMDVEKQDRIVIYGHGYLIFRRFGANDT